MKHLKFFLLIAMLPLITASCQQSTNYQNLNSEAFQKGIEETEDAVVLDVRTKQEVAQGKIPNAININYYDANFKEQISELDKTKTYYVYCRSGKRSALAAKLLNDLGFNKVNNLSGGILGWKGTIE